jgi:hypothetical protein
MITVCAPSDVSPYSAPSSRLCLRPGGFGDSEVIVRCLLTCAVRVAVLLCDWPPPCFPPPTQALLDSATMGRQAQRGAKGREAVYQPATMVMQMIRFKQRVRWCGHGSMWGDVFTQTGVYLIRPCPARSWGERTLLEMGLCFFCPQGRSRDLACVLSGALCALQPAVESRLHRPPHA